MAPSTPAKALASGRPPDARMGDPIAVAGRLIVPGVGSHQRLLSPRASAADLWSSVDSAATADGVKRLQKLHGTKLDGAAAKRLIAYVHQARQYYDVVAGLDPATKPLPAYYFVLNLSKAYLTLVDPSSTTAARISHGASDAYTPGQRYRFTQEYTKVSQSGVLRLLASRTGQGFCWPSGEKIQVAKLAAYLAEGADLYGDALGTKPKLVPIESTRVSASTTGAGKEAWLKVDVSRMVLEERQMSARALLGSAAIFGSQFSLVFDGADSDTVTYESIRPITYTKTAGVLGPIRQEFDRSLILRDRTASGGTDHIVLSARKQLLSMEGVSFLLLHHLSNMVRYRPQQVEALRGGSYWWLFTSWVDRACENFLLSMASRISLEEHLIL